MQHYGLVLFKSLVNAYNSLGKTNFVMRGLQPTSIYLSECALQVNFGDVVLMEEDNDGSEHKVVAKEPYSCYGDFERLRGIDSDRFLDTHSIAVILLEILVGTDLVLTC